MRGGFMKIRLVHFAVFVSFLVLGALALAGPPAANYHLLKKIPLGAAPGGGEYFDYITFDAPTRRVYLSHGTEVKVLDADSYQVVGTISGLQRCHGVVLVRDPAKGTGVKAIDWGGAVEFPVAEGKGTS